MEEDATIQQDEAEEPKLARDVVMDEIAAQVSAERVEDITPEPTSDPGEIVDLKVDGEIVQKTRGEIDSAGGQVEIQKSLTADKRLKEIAEEKKKIHAVRLEQEEQSKRLQAIQAKLEAQSQQPQPQISEAESTIAYKEYADAVYSGDHDQLIEATKKLNRMNVPVARAVPQLNTDDIETVISNRLAKVESKRNISKGVDSANEQYADIMNDKYLRAQANERTIDLGRDHPDWTEDRIIMEAVRLTDEWRGTKPVEDVMATRETKKKTALPVATSRNSVKTEYKPKTQDEIFAEMKANRSR